MNILVLQQKLRAKLSDKLAALRARQAELKLQLVSRVGPLRLLLNKIDLDIVVAHCEVNERHGVGILLKKIFPASSHILSIRSQDLYDGKQDFGCYHLCLNHAGKSNEQILSDVSSIIRAGTFRRILVVPYFRDDILTALALKELLNIPLCTYLMDDQNIFSSNIPDRDMETLLVKSDLRLGISKDLCKAYEEKYGQKFWFLPPTVDDYLIQNNFSQPTESSDTASQGVLIGNIWSQKWLDQLQTLTRGTGYKIQWYGNPNRDWITFNEADLEADGIFFRGYYPEDKLIEVLRAAPYAVILTGTTRDARDRPELAKLSLPSRLTYLVAVANLPIIVIGSQDTAAARFVKNLQLGLVCDYSLESFGHAVASICSSELQDKIRRQAAYLAQFFSAKNIDSWIWGSLQKGEPINFRFEQLGRILSQASAVVTAFEINQLHGTGPLVRRVVQGTPDILSIHSMDMYDGEHDFGELSLVISHNGLSRLESTQTINRQLGDNSVKQVLCVPYRSDDLITAITLSELHRAPLGTYIMDDQNIRVNNIPDSLMQEFLNKCSLRLATHPELREAYETKYGLKFWLLPAVVPDELISKIPQPFEWTEDWANSGVLLGSIWSKQWFDMLCAATERSGVKLDWYGNSQYPWLTMKDEAICKRGINPCGLLPEMELVEKLRCSPFVIVPTGTMDARDDFKELSSFSLPGRIIFSLATSNTPIIIVGHEETSASRFVERFRIGTTCDYDGKSLKEAISFVTDPYVQTQMRKNAASVAEKFSSKGISTWLWKSIVIGQPQTLRFEKLFSDVYSEGGLTHDDLPVKISKE